MRALDCKALVLGRGLCAGGRPRHKGRNRHGEGAYVGRGAARGEQYREAADAPIEH